MDDASLKLASNLCEAAPRRAKEPAPTTQPLSTSLCTRFSPAVGGIEAIAKMLAYEWTRAGHNVEIVTEVAAGSEIEPERPFRVHRNPNPREFIRIMRRVDVLVLLNVSLKMLWPAAITGTPFVVSHQSWYCTRQQADTWREQLKRWIARHRAAANISCSSAVREALQCGGEVIPNPFDHGRFRLLDVPRDRELVCVGRLVSDKGVDVLLRALGTLVKRGMRPRLTVIGDGPERKALESMADDLGVHEQVSFAGSQDHDALPTLLNRYKILVVPSRWDEPFGIVALEGAACGCVVVGSAGGGLPEAIGPCGMTFPNGDHEALAARLAELLENESRMKQYQHSAAEHLARHRSDVIAARYIEVCREVLGIPKPGAQS